ncbi:MAG TPA: aspartate kinase [Candidatus Bathyarchaeia archaeon]|nr:aspartate kinase [Candidatus Bathyarchaeia archaeon]
MKIVMKFGGSSLANSSRIRHVARIVKQYARDNNIVVVASAMGDTTDVLAEIGEHANKGDTRRTTKLLASLERTHLNASRTIAKRTNVKQLTAKILQLNSELARTVEGISHLRELTARSRDYLLSFGERLSVPILAAALETAGINARALTGAEAGIVTDDNFGEAKPLVQLSYQQVKQRIQPILSRKEVPVVTGFIASTETGGITTLGRGGSDYTASLLGAALDADEVWIWTDVDGLMTADPRIVKDAMTLQNVSFGEALELSYFGAKMMHPRALQPAAQNRLPVRIKNSSKPNNLGTLVSAVEADNRGKVVKAISIIRGVAIVTVSGTGMMGAPGVAAKVFQTLGDHRVNVMMISQGSSEATISCVVPRKDVDSAVRALQLSLLGQGYVEKVTAEKDVCIIAVVGSGMKGTPGVAARIFGAVARGKVNVRMVAQGSSEYNVSFVVSEGQGPEAVRAIHDEFQLGTSKA